MKLIAEWFIVALALILASEIIPGISVSGPYIALIVVLIFGILNITIKPILVLLTLPIHFLTLGLFTFVLNALLFWFVASFVDGFFVENFLSALLGSLVVSIGNAIGHELFKKRKR